MQIQPQELANALAQGNCQLIDVREPMEFRHMRISSAKLLPLGQVEAGAASLDRTRTVFVTCHAGKRGSAAMEKLQQMGFTDVRNLAGGMEAWKAAGLPYDQDANPGVSLMRQVQMVVGTGVVVGSILAVNVDPRWVYLPMFFGAGLLFAGVSGLCPLATLLGKMPWNNKNSTAASCSTKSCC